VHGKSCPGKRECVRERQKKKGAAEKKDWQLLMTEKRVKKREKWGRRIGEKLRFQTHEWKKWTGNGLKKKKGTENNRDEGNTSHGGKKGAPRKSRMSS